MLKSLLNFLLIILLFFSTIGYVAYQLVKPNFLVAQAENVRLYQQVTGQIGTLLPAGSLGDIPFSSTEVQSILTSAIDANTFYSNLNQASNAYLDYLTGRSSTLNYTLKLSALKSKVADQATAALIAKYQGLPTCKTSELKGWNAETSFPTCQLPATNVQSRDVDTLLGSQVNKTLFTIPDSWSAPTPTKSLAQTRARVTQILQLIRITWLATIGFILLYILILRRKAFLSLALIFLVVGALEVGFSFIAWDWLKRFIIDLFNHPDTSQQLVTMISTLVEDIVQLLKTLLGNLSIITLSIGGFFLILWGFTRFSRPKNLDNQLEIPRR